jgi:hypothetical protein
VTAIDPRSPYAPYAGLAGLPPADLPPAPAPHEEPPAPAPAAAGDIPRVRLYDLEYDRAYRVSAAGTVPGGLPLVWWDGADISPGETASGLTAVVTDVEGWYDTPPADGHNVERTLFDGLERGPKTLGARDIAVSGAAAGPYPALMRFRDMLAGLAAGRAEGTLTIGEPRNGGRTLTASTRADAESFRHTFLGGHRAFRWQVTLTAADPLLYEAAWRTARLVTTGGSGRTYARRFGWRYGMSQAPNTAWLANPGNTFAPAYALYSGQLDAARLVADAGPYAILTTPLASGEEVMVATALLAAEAGGGMTRAQFIRPGSRPLVVPPGGARWHLYSTGHGSVLLAWRGAWA